ncbi:MAG: anti-sigma factor [Acidimicrobiales bacterium]
MSDDDAAVHEQLDLIGLLAGKTDRDETIAMTRHLKVCPTCTEELIDVVLAHAALSSAARVNRTLALPPGAPSGDPSGARPAVSSGPGTPSLPPLTLPMKRGKGPRATRAPRSPRRLAVVVTVAAALVGLGALGASVVASHRSTGQPVVAQGSLQALQAPPSATGTVTVLAEGATRHMIVLTRDLSSPSSNEFYEVWLLDPATQKMLPVGVLPPSGDGDYAVTAGLMAGYSAVDVSLQRDDGNPVHSRTSVLRASLSA